MLLCGARHPEELVARYLIILAPVMAAACYMPDFVVVEAPDVLYSSVSVGDDDTCGLTTDGEVYCWPSTYPRPRQVSGSIEFSSVSTYADHSCGIAADGAAYCWGVNEWGQLGTLADLTSCGSSGYTVVCATSPVPVATDLLFQQISVGSAHTCALDMDGRAHCWGLNVWGQLGTDADSVCATEFFPDGIPCGPIPLRVAGQLVFESISAGQGHTCAVTTDGAGYCWGAGGSGRLGNGSLEDTPVPSPVVGDMRISTLSAGGNHTCAVLEDGSVYCWGSNAGLQLGSTAAEQGCGDQLSPCVTVPHPTSSDLRFSSITASGTMMRAGGPLAGHTCGISVDGAVYCWGLNENGQLAGHWDFTSSKPIRLESDVDFAQIDAGMANTCGVTTDERLLCWQYGTPWTEWRQFDGAR